MRVIVRVGWLEDMVLYLFFVTHMAAFYSTFTFACPFA
jgi:hypothetical protein